MLRLLRNLVVSQEGGPWKSTKDGFRVWGLGAQISMNRGLSIPLLNSCRGVAQIYLNIMSLKPKTLNPMSAFT